MNTVITSILVQAFDRESPLLVLSSRAVSSGASPVSPSPDSRVAEVVRRVYEQLVDADRRPVRRERIAFIHLIAK
jgi:hypothetical protein